METQKQSADFNSAEESWPAATRSNLSPEAPARASGIPGLRWLLLPASLAIAAVAGFFAYRDLGIPKPSVNPARLETALPLKLSVAEKQNQLDVTWDTNAPAIVQAKRGVLAISDGSKQQDLELSGGQLRTGRVLYSRRSDDVALQLEVFADGQDPVTESIRIVSTEPAHPVPKPPARAAESPEGERLTQSDKASPDIHGPARSGPGVDAKTGTGELMLGKVVHQVLPDVPKRARDTIRGKVAVRVRVRVDAGGNVVGAELYSPGPSRYFAKLALHAAQQWKFEPAKVDGRSVMSEWILRFEFKRTGAEAVPVRATL